MSTEYYQPLILSAGIGILLFTSTLHLTSKNSTNRFIQKTGIRLYDAKKKMSSKPIFKFIFQQLDQGKRLIAIVILSIMIFLKSVGMFLAGLILIGPLVLAVQGFFMGALKVQMRINGIPAKFNQVVTSQLSGHTIAMGFSLSIHWLINVDLLKLSINENLLVIIILVITVIISAIITAILETRMIQKEGISVLN